MEQPTPRAQAQEELPSTTNLNWSFVLLIMTTLMNLFAAVVQACRYVGMKVDEEYRESHDSLKFLMVWLQFSIAFLMIYWMIEFCCYRFAYFWRRFMFQLGVTITVFISFIAAIMKKELVDDPEKLAFSRILGWSGALLTIHLVAYGYTLYRLRPFLRLDERFLLKPNNQIVPLDQL